ncbi:P-loop containing nucleoside triphosphate hydrolase protein [Syncephalis fuscata]|nr:P-loop containing nucleoside triphosphate hydrolase protein [Syncephalis fuscata]
MDTLLVPRSVVLSSKGVDLGVGPRHGPRIKKANIASTVQSDGFKRKRSPSIEPTVSKRTRNTSHLPFNNTNDSNDKSLDSITDQISSNISSGSNTAGHDLTIDHDQQFTALALNTNADAELDTDDDEPIKEFAYYQRPALPDEPVCVICGRYGEYVNDATDRDVCSLECKAKDIESIKTAPSMDIIAEIPPNVIAPPIYRPIERFHAHLVAYQTHASMAQFSAEEIDALRVSRQIKARGRHIPPILADLDHLVLPEQLKTNLKEAGYDAPTPIQMQVIPAALAARDIVAAAPTGSGKTLSFLLPCIMHAYALNNAFHGEGRPYVFVIAPTHDLCAQLEVKAQALCHQLPDMRTALLTGEYPIPPQWHRLRCGVALVFATPGRLDRILDEWPCYCTDEVDRLLDTNDKEMQIKQLLDRLTTTDMPLFDGSGHPHQLMVFSATRAWRTRRILKPWLHDPIRVGIGELDMITPDKRLFLLLSDPLRYPLPAIVFVESRLGAELLAKAIIKRCPGVRARHVHGDMPATERESIIQATRKEASSIDVIVATSGLWARGIDIPQVRLVINFDMPRHLDEYIHQVGRAGRAGEIGRAVTFINDDNKSLFRELLEMLRSLPSSKIDTLPIELRRYASHRHPLASTILDNPNSRINQPKSAFKFIQPPSPSTGVKLKKIIRKKCKSKKLPFVKRSKT